MFLTAQIIPLVSNFSLKTAITRISFMVVRFFMMTLYDEEKLGFSKGITRREDS